MDARLAKKAARKPEAGAEGGRANPVIHPKFLLGDKCNIQSSVEV
jgi:hypothetical protein